MRTQRSDFNAVLDSLKTLKTLQVDAKTYHYFSLPDAARSLGDLDKLPMSLKVLLENLLRWEDEKTVTGADLKALAGWLKERRPTARFNTARHGC